MAVTHIDVDVLRFVDGYTRDNSYPPAHEEIREHFGWASRYQVERHLKRLEENHVISRKGRQPRTIRIIDRRYLDAPQSVTVVTHPNGRNDRNATGGE